MINYFSYLLLVVFIRVMYNIPLFFYNKHYITAIIGSFHKSYV